MYIIFLINGGSNYVSWDPHPNPQYGNAFPSMPRGIEVKYKKLINKVEILQNVSSSVVEGTFFSRQPALKVTDSSNSGVEGIACFAVLERYWNITFPGKFSLGEPYSVYKKLTYSVSASYNISCDFKLLNCMQLKFTNSSGIVEFESLGMSQYGQIGASSISASLYFECAGVRSSSFEFFVNSSITHLNISNIPEAIQVYASSSYKDFTGNFQFIANNTPLLGKTIDSVIVFLISFWIIKALKLPEF